MSAPPQRGLRLGVYQDGPFRIVDAHQETLVPAANDRAFLRFVEEVGSHFEAVLLFARARHVASADDEAPLSPEIRFAELPYYDSLVDLGQVARATPGTVRGFWRGLSRVDVVWALGPHPFSLLLVVVALVRRKRVALGVRQDSVAYFRSRLRGGRATPALVVARICDVGYRLIARRVPTVVVGDDLARQYGGPRPGLLAINVAQVRSDEILAEPPRRDWSGPVTLLTVSRIDREKNPLLLVETLARLAAEEPGRYALTWIGDGPLTGDARRRAAELGVLDLIDFRGFMPFGPHLIELYRTAHVFVHVSLTEGVPATIVEAQASGTPVVATDVGGVRDALVDGRAGLLVPPRDIEALVAAVRRVADEPLLRDELALRGLENAAARTLDLNAGRVARFLHGEMESPQP